LIRRSSKHCGGLLNDRQALVVNHIGYEALSARGR
jgi:hypothetical protein